MQLIIVFSIIAGFSIPFFTYIFSRRILLFRSKMIQYITASVFGFLLWFFLARIFNTPWNNEWDILCGTLIILCAIWSNYWLGNLGGGFRINMLLKIAEQKQPVSLDEWMDLYGGLGMDAFLSDRLKAILLPWKIVEEKNGIITLTKERGYFWGWGMKVLYQLLQGSRRE